MCFTSYPTVRSLQKQSTSAYLINVISLGRSTRNVADIQGFDKSCQVNPTTQDMVQNKGTFYFKKI